MHLLAMAPQDQPNGVIKVIERDWHNDIILIIQNKLPKFLAVLLIVFALQRLVLFFVRRLRRRADNQARINFHRAAQLRTMASTIRATSYGIFGFIVFLQFLNLFNIPYQPILASAGILGVAVGLGAQSIFKDMLNGILILFEDQYNVGEVVNLAGLKGTVEDLSLRRTTLRDADGTLYIIPNSQIATVSNLSRDYAVATLNVSVDASANPDKVIALLSNVAEQVRNDPGFKDITVADPVILGVDKIEGRSVTYPVQIRVHTNKRDIVLRELRRQVILAFEKNGIPLGNDPANMLILRAPNNPTAPPAQQPLIGS
jgi:moderate conductance mechanosensitive channel